MAVHFDLDEGKQDNQQTVSGQIEHIVILPCPFCGSEHENLGGEYYCCSNANCCAVSLDCTVKQWNSRATTA